ncbi:efflux RND transporter periplasmic adaptor subunit [Falsirhodobacter xinxiangensis]|uniref:efflux RND transporter periplasmic adaptor subunit n=1 Tax=Falsirhodobacter xinxiangensis TaxID=2530049 RepID=UPI0010AB14C3|nr:efflux RND transporter periplasmic adaptor subunit [Rhodobacter xinxiangensis]
MRIETLLLAVSVALAPAARAADTAPPAISVVAVTQTVLRDRVIASGLIAPVEQVQVQPLIEGQPIESLEAEVGDTVAAGQTLARLSTATLDLQRGELSASRAASVAAVAQGEAQIAEARATAAEARRVADRTAALRSQGASSQAGAETAEANAASAEARLNAAVQAVEAARAQVALADAQLANLDLQLARTQVIAPVAGEVVERNALVGAIASAQAAPMFTLIRDGALELRADVTEGDLLRIVPGLTVRLMPVAGDPFDGTVRLVEPRIDETTRLGRVRISVDVPGLRAGMFVRAEILIAETEAPAVPLTALARDADGSYLLRVEGGTVRRIAVTPGIRDGAMVQVLGADAGAEVVAKAGAFVREGDRVTPVRQ